MADEPRDADNILVHIKEEFEDNSEQESGAGQEIRVSDTVFQRLYLIKHLLQFTSFNCTVERLLDVTEGCHLAIQGPDASSFNSHVAVLFHLPIHVHELYTGIKQQKGFTDDAVFMEYLLNNVQTNHDVSSSQTYNFHMTRLAEFDPLNTRHEENYKQELMYDEDGDDDGKGISPEQTEGVELNSQVIPTEGVKLKTKMVSILKNKGRTKRKISSQTKKDNVRKTNKTKQKLQGKVNKIDSSILDRVSVKSKPAATELTHQLDEDNIAAYTLTDNQGNIKIVEKKLAQTFDLTQHQQKFTPEEPKVFTCEQCQKTFKTWVGLYQHRKVHGEAMYKCDLCPYASHWGQGLKLHMKTHEPESVRQKEKEKKMSFCKPCNKWVIAKPHNKSVHRTTICDLCGIEVKVGCLNMHRYRHHGKSRRRKKCPVDGCEFIYSSSNVLLRHQGRSHGLQNSAFCDQCGKGFLSGALLNMHMSCVHTACPCPWEGCTKVINGKYALRIHMRTHTGEMPHKCPLCDYKGKQRASLHWHVKKTHPEAAWLKY